MFQGARGLYGKPGKPGDPGVPVSYSVFSTTLNFTPTVHGSKSNNKGNKYLENLITSL